MSRQAAKTEDNTPESLLQPEATGYYALGAEAERLTRQRDTLEFLRTQELALRYLPPAPAVILDVGGGPGAYALWLARLGYTVHLIDAMPLHVAQAQAASDAQPDAPLASATLGDARRLTQPDASADATLLLGPLYHLTERDDRVQALREARRVTRAGGVVLAAAISRYASLIDCILNGRFADPVASEIVEQDIANGQHRNPTNHPRYFTTAYFHHPSELAEEMADAGLRRVATLAIEGLGWLATQREDWNDPKQRERILTAVRLTEQEPSVLGATSHLLAIARIE